MSEADRELMTNTTTEAGGLYKYQFMKLPPELQDEITEGLDTRQITLAQAERIAKGGGYQISGESVRRYYKRLLTMRRNSEVRNAWLRAGDALREMGADKVLQTFLTYMMGQLMGGVESGQIDFPVKDFLKLLGDIPEQLAKSLSGREPVKSRDAAVRARLQASPASQDVGRANPRKHKRPAPAIRSGQRVQVFNGRTRRVCAQIIALSPHDAANLSETMRQRVASVCELYNCLLAFMDHHQIDLRMVAQQRFGGTRGEVAAGNNPLAEALDLELARELQELPSPNLEAHRKAHQIRPAGGLQNPGGILDSVEHRDVRIVPGCKQRSRQVPNR